MLEEHKPLHFIEHRIVRIGGEVIHVEMAAAPLTFEGNRPRR